MTEEPMAITGIGERTVIHRFITGLALILAMAWQPVFAQAAPDAESQRRLAEQKLKLVEMMVNSPKARASGEGKDAETAALVERGRQLLKQAREELAAQRFAEAARALDEAMKSVS